MQVVIVARLSRGGRNLYTARYSNCFRGGSEVNWPLTLTLTLTPTLALTLALALTPTLGLTLALTLTLALP